MSMNYTSIEQSKKLLELGLSPESADMYYELIMTDDHEAHYKNPKPSSDVNVNDNTNIPCWSLKSLLSLYPEIEVESNIETFICKSYGLEDGELLKQIKGFDWIEPTFRMVVWLLENNYIKPIK